MLAVTGGRTPLDRDGQRAIGQVHVLANLGSRLAVSSGSTFGWTLPDLHGDIAGYANVGLTGVTDAFRYDPYGELLASVTSTTPSPWRYQGKLLDNTGAGTSELYDFGFRSYAPGLGAPGALAADAR